MKKGQLCVLCGVRAASTGKGDHLPPKSLYTLRQRVGMQMNTVPACSTCNNGASKDDELFKIYIGLSTGESRVDQEDVIDTLARTLSRNRKLAKRILQNRRQVYVPSPEGILTPMTAIHFDREAYCRVIERIVRGLYWKQTNEILTDMVVTVVQGDEPEGRAVTAIKKLLETKDPELLNGGTFAYKVFFDNENGSSFWALQFFSKHTTFALVDPIEQ